jgi:hypothetical protein
MLELGADYEAQLQMCAIMAQFGEDMGMACFKDMLGMTESCARLNLYKTYYINTVCLNECLTHILFQLPSNLPNCRLSPCLACDQVKAGKKYTEFAGRTTFSSGLLSSVVRKCSNVPAIPVLDPCPNATEPTEVSIVEDVLNLLQNRAFGN